GGPALHRPRGRSFRRRRRATGASEGPHVHFEIRDNKTENCLNPLLFGFPIADGVSPTITRLAMYDRNKSTYDQSPQLLSLKKSGSYYSVTKTIIVGSDKISFAIGAIDRFSATPNPNGIYSTRLLMDNIPVTGFELKDISYNDTRYINAQLDFPFKSRGGAALQHISPLPGAKEVAYQLFNEDGIIHLNDEEPHVIVIEIKDANQNTSRIRFTVQYNKGLSKNYPLVESERFIPQHVNIFEKDFFELITTEKTIYDTISVNLILSNNYATGSISPTFGFLNSSIPVHDSVTVRIKPNVTVTGESANRIIIKNVSGTRTYIQKAKWQREWVSAKFRQFGTYQVFIDNEPPTVNAPSANLSKASRIVFTPRDNFNVIKNFRVELNGQWLRFTNDKGRSWVYTFDEKFPRGSHELKVIAEDEAGNVMERRWTVTR
ncbi:MAG: Ig-like domain-containing protein, partial [Flavisolibacter sp.]